MQHNSVFQKKLIITFPEFQTTDGKMSKKNSTKIKHFYKF